MSENGDFDHPCTYMQGILKVSGVHWVNKFGIGNVKICTISCSHKDTAENFRRKPFTNPNEACQDKPRKKSIWGCM